MYKIDSNWRFNIAIGGWRHQDLPKRNEFEFKREKKNSRGMKSMKSGRGIHSRGTQEELKRNSG